MPGKKESLEIVLRYFDAVFVDSSFMTYLGRSEGFYSVDKRLLDRALEVWRENSGLFRRYNEELKVYTTNGIIQELNEFALALEEASYKKKQTLRANKLKSMSDLVKDTADTLIVYPFRAYIQVVRYDGASDNDISLISAMLHFLVDNNRSTSTIITKDSDISKSYGLTISGFDEGLRANISRRGKIYWYDYKQNLLEKVVIN
ncbi:hypothetical protein HYU23_01670 [Candidatus Woesearchaeota archaeon]|nr:hypothetical protein [Candidatus Woesearchaeota archaeon]